MIEYRVTKYDPAMRDARGAYLVDEWTAMSDIGSEFGGRLLSEEEYLRVEQAYIDSACAFIGEGGLSSFKVDGLEDHGGPLPNVGDGATVGAEEAGDWIRGMLREEFWCRLEGDGGFVHVGSDFYMYIGVPRRCPEAEKVAGELGLYAEEFESPY